MRIYLIVLAALAALTVLMAGQDVALIVVLGTMGIAFPFVFAATGLIYGLCAAPLVVLWRAGARPRAVGVVASVVLVAFVALAPYYLGRYAADAASAVLRASDHAPNEPVGASTLEIRRPAESYDDTFADQRACGIECRTLLLTGQARWVRVVEVGHPNARRPAPFIAPCTARIARRRAHSPDDNAVCVVDAPDPGDPANLVIDFTIPIGSEAGLPLSPFASVVRKRAVVVRTGKTDQASETMRQTEITVETPIRPSAVRTCDQVWAQQRL